MCGTLVTPSSAAVPALPGATKTLNTRGDCASFHASACSRPPEPMTRIFILVAEMPDAGKYHGDALLVRRGDDFGVAHAAAGLDDRRARRPARRRRGRRGTGRTHRRRRPSPRASSPAFCALIEAMRAESTRLICPAPTPSVLAAAAEHDRVRLHELRDAPREQRDRRARCASGARLRHDLELGRVDVRARPASARAGRRRRA